MTAATFALSSGAPFGQTPGRRFLGENSSLSMHVGEGVQQSSSYAAAKAAAAMHVTSPSVETVPTTATQIFDPNSRRPHALVQPEDCEFYPVFANNPGKSSPPLGFLGPAVHRGQGPVGKNLSVGSQQVYVQDAQNACQFKPIAQERARRVYGVGGSSQAVNRGRARAKDHKNGRNRQDQATNSKIFTVPALRAISLDRDALFLEPSKADERILEVLVHGERWMLSAVALFFACQCALAGLSFLHAALVFASRPKPAIVLESEQDLSIGADALADVLLVLEPYLTGLTTFCAELGFIGALLRVFHAHERATTKAAVEAAEAIGDQALTRENLDELELRQEALSLVTLALIGAVCNFSVAVASYVGMANTAQLLFNGRAALPVDITAGPDTVEALSGGFKEWHATTARLLIGLRAGFGIFAFFPALLEMLYIVSPTLPDFTMASQEGNVVSLAEEAKALEEASCEPWPGAPPQNEATMNS